MNIRQSAVVVTALTLALAACDRNKSGAEEAVRAGLKDPESARFGVLYFNTKTGKGCLTVNAKNSMGGYTGDQQAYVEKTDKGWVSIDIADISVDLCREIHADQPAMENTSKASSLARADAAMANAPSAANATSMAQADAAMARADAAVANVTAAVESAINGKGVHH